MAIDPVCRALIALLVLALVTGRRSAAAAGAPPAVEEQQGVVCTMVKNETRYVAEWLAFHFLVGATKIVIYDDNQGRDSLREVAAPFGERVVIHDLSRMPELPAELRAENLDPRETHHAWPYGQRQVWALTHCGRTYGARNASGWLAVIDVDEFIFPCNASSPSLGQAFRQRIGTMTPGTVGLHLECLKFGFNDLGRPLRPGELLVKTESRRAPYKQLEPQVEPALRQALECKDTCINVGAHKIMYRLQDAGWVDPGIHGPRNGMAMRTLNRTAWDRSSGVCCNHYMLRSEEEAKVKYTKANAMGYFHRYTAPTARIWYRSVVDTLAWRFLPGLTQALNLPSWQGAVRRRSRQLARRVRHMLLR